MLRTTSQTQRQVTAHDASHFLLSPREIAAPTTVEEMAELFSEADRNRRTVTLRGAGTSLAGQSLSDDILVDVKRGFRGIEVLNEGQRVRVGTGVTLAAVNAVLAGFGRKLGADPESQEVATIGGVIANNANGIRGTASDSTLHTMESCVLVLPTGRVIDTADRNADITLRLDDPLLVEGLLTLRRRLRDDPRSLKEIRRFAKLRNSMGYSLTALVDNSSPLEIARQLMVGSEGTLGFVAEAIFLTAPLVKLRASALVILPNLTAATRAIKALRDLPLSALELLNNRALMTGQRVPTTELLGDQDIEQHAGLLVEVSETSQDKLAGQISQVQQLLRGFTDQDTEFVTDPAEQEQLWRMRHELYPSIMKRRENDVSVLLEDCGVPVDKLGTACERITEVFIKHNYRSPVIFGHAKTGVLHYVVLEDFTDPPSLRRYRRFRRDLNQTIWELKGTLSAESGTGRALAPFLAEQYGPELFEVMREVKALFDPKNTLNPGVIITTEEDAHTQNLKAGHPDAQQATEDHNGMGANRGRQLIGKSAGAWSSLGSVGRRALTSLSIGKRTAAKARGDLSRLNRHLKKKRRVNPVRLPTVWYFPVTHSELEPNTGNVGSMLALAERAGVPMRVVDTTRFQDLGATGSDDDRSEQIRAAFASTSEAVVVYESVTDLPRLEALADGLEIHLVDELSFAAYTLLPLLQITNPVTSLALHEHNLDADTRQAVSEIADSISRHPDTTSVWEVDCQDMTPLPSNEQQFACYATTDRACELPLTRAAGTEVIHILDLLERVTEPH